MKFICTFACLGLLTACSGGPSTSTLPASISDISAATPEWENRMRDVTKGIPFEQQDTESSSSLNVQEAVKQNGYVEVWIADPYDWHPPPYFRQRIKFGEYVEDYEMHIRKEIDNIKIEFYFIEEGLENVVEFVRQSSGISIIIDPDVRSDKTIMGKKVTFKAKGIVLSECIKTLLSSYGLTYSIRERVLYISRPPDKTK